MLIIYLLISLAVIAIDQGVKYWIVANFGIGEVQKVVNGLLSLTYIKNSGAAWSILEGKIVFFALVTIIAVVVVSYFLVRYYKSSVLLALGLALVLGGAVGNFIDRIRWGYVVDMIQLDFINFPIFNIADSALTIGVVLIFSYSLLEERLKGKKND
ncbi:MAG TPA: signal peptidase II [Tetragenococcus sp.]|nr:signal peptidase II [Tetragenococcus sp.]